eukprot:SAG31_NODE_17018_length_686_cov_1.241908_1_plen_90_part_00
MGRQDEVGQDVAESSIDPAEAFLLRVPPVLAQKQVSAVQYTTGCVAAVAGIVYLASGLNDPPRFAGTLRGATIVLERTVLRGEQPNIPL